MSNEPEINPSASPAKSESETPKNQDAAAKEAAAKALGHAKDSVAAGVANFKKLDLQNQIYLTGLVIVVLCATVFSAVSLSVKMDGPMADVVKHNMSSMKASPSVFNIDPKGWWAVISAAGGIGLWIWNFMTAKKQAWVPLALTGCAGLSTLLLLLIWIQTQRSAVDAGIVKVSASMTLFGFWLPLAGAIAAVVVSVKRILNPPPAPTA
jgi:hypothetical protein